MDTTGKKNHHIPGIPAECRACLIKQAQSAARFAGLTEYQTQKVIAAAEAGLEASRTMPLLPQHIVRRVADAVIRERGESPDFDIYAAVKKSSNRLCLACADAFQKQLDESPHPLETGLQMAAAGNIIDFGAINDRPLDLDKEIPSFMKIPFARYDLKALQSALNGASSLLYLCDNSGEIVFDMIFMKTLRRMHPALQITAALREKPIINDATLADAKAVGLDRVVTAMSSGSIYPGTFLQETTDAFQKTFAAADLIISKGQGNLETLLPLSDRRLFFLLRIKCDYMASLTGVQKGSLVLMQGGRNDPSSFSAPLTEPLI